MPIIFDANDKPKFVGPVADFNNIFESILNDIGRDICCPHCHTKIKIPLVGTEEDAHRIYYFIDMLTNYMDEHPEIAYHLLGEFIQRWREYKKKMEDDGKSG